MLNRKVITSKWSKTTEHLLQITHTYFNDFKMHFQLFSDECQFQWKIQLRRFNRRAILSNVQLFMNTDTTRVISPTKRWKRLKEKWFWNQVLITQLHSCYSIPSILKVLLYIKENVIDFSNCLPWPSSKKIYGTITTLTKKVLTPEMYFYSWLPL